MSQAAFASVASSTFLAQKRIHPSLVDSGGGSRNYFLAQCVPPAAKQLPLSDSQVVRLSLRIFHVRLARLVLAQVSGQAGNSMSNLLIVVALETPSTNCLGISRLGTPCWNQICTV